MLMLVIIVFAVCTNAKAQNGEAPENKNQLRGDISMISQVDEQGQTDAVGGITIKDEGSVSFYASGSLATKTAGFWSSINGKKYHVRVYDQNGNSYAIIEIQGLVRWDKNRNVIEGKENFLRIKTTDDPNIFIEITNRTINKAGELIISTLNGPKFKITDLSSNFYGTIIIVPSLKYFYKSKPIVIGVIFVVLAIAASSFALWYRRRKKHLAAGLSNRDEEVIH